MIRGKKVYRRFVAAFGRMTVRERCAFQAGRRFRTAYGPRPSFVGEWNGSAPYCKHLTVPTMQGPKRVRWANHQREREAWELGWETEHARAGGAS